MAAPKVEDTSKLSGICVFKWNRSLPENSVPPGSGLLMFLVNTRTVFVSTTNPDIKSISYSVDPNIFLFELKDLLTRDTLEKLIHDGLGVTYEHVIQQYNMNYLASKISNHLASNFVFSVDTLSYHTNNQDPKIVIVVEINRSIVLRHNAVEADVEEDKDWVFNLEEIDAGLRKALKVPRFYEARPVVDCEPFGLVEVPPLGMFEVLISGGGESDHEEENNNCAICLEDLLLMEQKGISRKTPCSHVFHGDCLARWLWRKQSCPMCRSSLCLEDLLYS